MQFMTVAAATVVAAAGVLVQGMLRPLSVGHQQQWLNHMLAQQQMLLPSTAAAALCSITTKAAPSPRHMGCRVRWAPMSTCTRGWGALAASSCCWDHLAIQHTTARHLGRLNHPPPQLPPLLLPLRQHLRHQAVAPQKMEVDAPHQMLLLVGQLGMAAVVAAAALPCSLRAPLQ